MKAADIMSKEVVTVGPDASVEETAAVLVKNNISGVPVVDDKNKIIGIVTQKDIMYKDVEPRFPPYAELLGGLIFLGGVREYNDELKKALATRVEEIMTRKVITVKEDTDIQEIAQLMVRNNINRIPVTDNKGGLSGIISRADVIRFIAGL